MERVSLVMGGASPVGRAIANRLIEDGHLVAILDGDPDGVARAEADYDPDVSLAFAVDTTDPEDMAEVVDAIAERFGPPTGLVIVAPPFPSTPFLESGTEAVNAMLEQHVFGAMSLALLTAERMEAGGSVVAVLPAAPNGPNGPRVLAATARAALGGFIASAASELARAGIRVNAVQIGGKETATPILVRHGFGRTPQSGVTGAEIAAAVHFLMSEDAAHVTAQTLTVGAVG